MSAVSLEVRDLRRRFGSVRALDGLSFSIPERATAAFVGANGAGKTTTFAVIARFIRPHGGSVRIDGRPAAEYRAGGGQIGVLPQDMQFFEHRSVRRQLILFAALSGMSWREAGKEADRVLELTDLQEKARARVEELSRGMRVRLGTAQALIASPPLVLLDEPMAGLDPKMRASFRRLISELRGTTTLVISSHELSELQSLCDYVCIIDKGKTIFHGAMSEALGKGQRHRVKYRLDRGPASVEPLRALLGACEVETTQEEGASFLIVSFDPSQLTVRELNDRVLPWLLENDLGVLAVDSEQSLEEAYLRSLS